MKENLDNEAENIFDTWELYRKIVSFNNMFHREIYADVAEVLRTCHDFALLDLGCGDAVNLAPVLTSVPIGRYCGVDLSATALDFAEQNLNGLSCPVTLQLGDLLQSLHETDLRYDVIFTSFALHHLNFGQKADFFKTAYDHLNAGGFLLMIDTVREEHEDLTAYLKAYCAWLRGDWQGIDNQEKEIACQHIVDNDFPETLSTLQAFAQQAGFAACHAIGSYKWHKVLRFVR